ncbi:hypothetical protein K402DRAFT_166306 [Aulographum hederae CBS 113979]|uniref:Uncharacterized protein n=1 Tax=Aulographum hederae CBS 113979 TaxID=1176131 RepID=A0A6G1GRI9_9PEZI|nr:hypothetical protein K402DRAFT_166306 [Aulographum hederae CBS 113979]
MNLSDARLGLLARRSLLRPVPVATRVQLFTMALIAPHHESPSPSSPLSAWQAAQKGSVSGHSSRLWVCPILIPVCHVTCSFSTLSQKSVFATCHSRTLCHRLRGSQYPGAATNRGPFRVAFADHIFSLVSILEIKTASQTAIRICATTLDPSLAPSPLLSDHLPLIRQSLRVTNHYTTLHSSCVQVDIGHSEPSSSVRIHAYVSIPKSLFLREWAP